jgi:hypothetical protein
MDEKKKDKTNLKLSEIKFQTEHIENKQKETIDIIYRLFFTYIFTVLPVELLIATTILLRIENYTWKTISIILASAIALYIIIWAWIAASSKKTKK